MNTANGTFPAAVAADENPHPITKFQPFYPSWADRKNKVNQNNAAFGSTAEPARAQAAWKLEMKIR